MAKVEELKNLSRSELEEKISNLKKELFELKTLAKSARIEKPHRIRLIRKDIARIFTLLKEKEREQK